MQLREGGGAFAGGEEAQEWREKCHLKNLNEDP